MRSLTPLFVLAAVLGAAWLQFADRETHWRPGVMAPDEPLQTAIDDDESFSQESYRVTPRAHFSATVRVLHKESYWLGDFAGISPIDFAVGWGPMSDSAILKFFEVSQSGRFFFWHSNDMPIPRADIERSASNWHMVPANESVRKQLVRVRAGDIVTIEGKLVDITAPNGSVIRTSLVRTDTGAGACEVVWVESITTRFR